MATKSGELNDRYRNTIRGYTKPVKYMEQFDNGGTVKWLANQIRDGARPLKYNSIDFIIGKFLDKRERLINYSHKDFINIYVIGTFRNEFIPTMKVAKALAEFYLEMRVMPNINIISKKNSLADPALLKTRIINGILIYDREGNLH